MMLITFAFGISCGAITMSLLLLLALTRLEKKLDLEIELLNIKLKGSKYENC